MPTQNFELAEEKAFLVLNGVNAMSDIERIAYTQLKLSAEMYSKSRIALPEIEAQYVALMDEMLMAARRRAEHEKGRMEDIYPDRIRYSGIVDKGSSARLKPFPESGDEASPVSPLD